MSSRSNHVFIMRKLLLVAHRQHTTGAVLAGIGAAIQIRRDSYLHPPRIEVPKRSVVLQQRH